MNRKLVIVRWIDHVSAHYSPGDWVEISDYDNVKLAKMETVGWLIKEDDDLVVIAATISETTAGNDMVIAKRLIDDMTEIKIPRRKKK